MFNWLLEQMTYRPSIPEDVDERVDYFLAGKSAHKNETYTRAIKVLIDEDGNERDMFERMERFIDDEDISVPEALDYIVSQVIDEDGEPNLEFRKRLELDELRDSTN